MSLFNNINIYHNYEQQTLYDKYSQNSLMFAYQEEQKLIFLSTESFISVINFLKIRDNF